MNACGNSQMCHFVQLQPYRPIPYSQLVSCLANKRVFIGGNSVTRHWAFVLFEMLQNVSVPHSFIGNSDAMVQASIFDHSAQQSKCGKGVFGRPDDPAACSLSAGLNTTINFGWVQRVHSPDLELLFNDSSFQPDIVLLGAGSDDVWDKERRPKWRQTHQHEAPLLKLMLQRVGAERPHTRIYWRGLTPNCPSDQWSLTNELLAEASSGLLSTLCHQHGKRGPAQHLHIVDNWAWAYDKCSRYDDNFHHSLLAWDFVSSLMRDACGINAQTGGAPGYRQGGVPTNTSKWHWLRGHA